MENCSKQNKCHNKTSEQHLQQTYVNRLQSLNLTSKSGQTHTNRAKNQTPRDSTTRNRQHKRPPPTAQLFKPHRHKNPKILLLILYHGQTETPYETTPLINHPHASPKKNRVTTPDTHSSQKPFQRQHARSSADENSRRRSTHISRTQTERLPGRSRARYQSPRVIVYAAPRSICARLC